MDHGHDDDRLCRIECRLDAILRLQGETLEGLAELVDAKGDEAKELKLIAKLRASADKLKAAVAANQPT